MNFPTENAGGFEAFNQQLKTNVDLWSSAGGAGEMQGAVSKMVTEGFKRGYQLEVEFMAPEDENRQYVDEFEAKEETPDGFYRVLVKSDASDKENIQRPYLIISENGDGFRIANQKDQVIVIKPDEVVGLKFVLPKQ